MYLLSTTAFKMERLNSLFPKDLTKKAWITPKTYDWSSKNTKGNKMLGSLFFTISQKEREQLNQTSDCTFCTVLSSSTLDPTQD